jgi:uncharacterized protein (TIGR03032 family)
MDEAATKTNGQSAGKPTEALAITTSRHFLSWMAGINASIAFTTYQAGKLIMLGLKRDGRLAVFERTFARSMGIGVFPGGRSLVLATQWQLIRFDDILRGQAHGENDALFGPHAMWVTGDVDAHEVAILPGGRPLFVNTLFSCIAEASDGFNFRLMWKPKFITKLAPEDRCHLNGMAMENDKPKFVTVVAPSDVGDGWRDRRMSGGQVIDIESGEAVAGGLSMPHSPRLYGGKLWLLNSGTGEFGFVDRDTGKFQAVAFCPGYARGLAFVGRHAIVGLSLARENRTFQGLALDDELPKRGAEARCGLLIIDIQSGDTIGWVRIEGVVRELFDVAILPGVKNPSIIGFKTDEVKHTISMDE